MSVNTQLVNLQKEETGDRTTRKKTAQRKAINATAILAEIVSTMFLVSLGCMCTVPIDGLANATPMYGPLGFGLIVLFNITSFGHLSGAHMNPAVTLAAVIWGQTSIVSGILYFMAQCTGSTIGYGILVALSPTGFTSGAICVTQPSLKYTVYQALGFEVILTAALVFITCAVWDPVNKDSQESNAIKVGLTVAGLSFAGGPMTGAGMNPARSLGPAIWTSSWRAHWVYWAGPFLGSFLAVLIYKFIWLPDNKKTNICAVPDTGEGLVRKL
ncbi:aquaporin-like [Leptidea sinapis]|uniref:aquaporin-like n=1 Tax=Leptidea sinapis TaxID=189913 RepID=UPI0021C3A48C|nr:aquaporin-like [Leptidea sinapis]